MTHARCLLQESSIGGIAPLPTEAARSMIHTYIYIERDLVKEKSQCSGHSL
jgi:hypothetical protein